MTLRGGRLLHLRCGSHEIWSAVAFIYRDADWGTPEPVFDAVAIEPRPGGFLARLRGRFPVTPAIDLQLEIEGGADGRVSFAAEAIPSAEILANRLGLCVMHPMASGGARVEIEHVDGRYSASTLPTLVPPWPPFTLVRAIRHEWAERQWARCELQGDIFEFEDQRNNADASFKTYSRSNSMPRPYRLEGGVPIRQRAELSGDFGDRILPMPPPEPLRVDVGEAIGALPSIGLEITAGDARAADRYLDALATLRPAHLHLQIEPNRPAIDWPGVGRLLAAAGAVLRLDLEVDATSAVDRVAEALARDLAAAGLEPESLAIFPTDRRAVAAARAAFRSARIGGGTPFFFAQFNRLEGLEAPGLVDFASFTTASTVHGAADDEVMLGLQSLPSLLATVQARYPGLPVRIGPSAIAARRSPLGRQPLTDGSRRLALAARDPRVRGLFGAAWTLGYVAHAAPAGVQALTLLSLGGASGVLEDGPGEALARRPVAEVIEWLGRPATLRRVSVSAPGRLAAVAIDRDARCDLLLANLGAEPLEVELASRPGSIARRRLDAFAVLRLENVDTVETRRANRRGLP